MNNRLELVRYIGPETNYGVQFAIRAGHSAHLPIGYLVAGADNVPGRVYVFEHARDAIDFVVTEMGKHSSLEWTGTTW